LIDEPLLLVPLPPAENTSDRPAGGGVANHCHVRRSYLKHCTFAAETRRLALYSAAYACQPMPIAIFCNSRNNRGFVLGFFLAGD
jgi:hypothetical protein